MNPRLTGPAAGAYVGAWMDTRGRPTNARALAHDALAGRWRRLTLVARRTIRGFVSRRRERRAWRHVRSEVRRSQRSRPPGRPRGRR